MIKVLLMKLRARDTISAEEERAIRDGFGQARTIAAGTTFTHAGERLHASTLLVDGIVCRYKDLRGGQRQITELSVAGDFVDLHGFTLKRLDHSLLALTDCKVAAIPHDKLREIIEAFSHLARVFWFQTNLDAAIHREWQLSLGRRNALARMAHLFCELHVRLDIVGGVVDDTYNFQLTQAVLADCLGLTTVHVNRVLQDLRGRGLIEFRRGVVHVKDLNGLKAVAEFDPGYLYLDRVEQ